MKKLDLTIVCCYNRKEQLDKELLKTLNDQSASCELVLIDNSNNKFKSAASALNYGASKVKTKYVLFSHQDICFLNDNSLEEIYNYMVKYSNAIIGVAGVKLEQIEVYTSILHGEHKKLAGEIIPTKPEKVISLDECLFGMSMDIYNKLKFDEINFDNWHLYAVDICYNANSSDIDVYVVPSNIWHTSSGKLNNSFFKGVKKLRKKYGKKYDIIKSTCITINKNENLFVKKLKLTKLPNSKIYNYYLKIKKKH